MIVIQGIEGKNFGVYGLGRTGRATLDCLKRSGAKCVAFDDNTKTKAQFEDEGYAILAPADWDWAGLDALILSPGIPHMLPEPHPIARLAAMHHVPIITDIDLLMKDRRDVTLIGITGTNGKSTTTALIGYALEFLGQKTVVAGNIGSSPLNYSWAGSSLYGVLELSSFHLERMQKNCLNAAVFLNLTPDHLDRHGTLQGYMDAKSRIFNSADLKVVVMGVDQPIMEAGYSELVGKPFDVIPVSCEKELKNGIYVSNDRLYDNYWDCGEVFNLASCHYLRGIHNAQNIAATYALLKYFGLETQMILEAFKTFQGLPHRTELVGSYEDVIFVNDSKATNVESACKALSGYDNIYWIVGGKYKNDALDQFDLYLHKVKKVYGIGSSLEVFGSYLKDKVTFERSEFLENAVYAAYRDAKASNQPSVILLSPACASFDQFESFEHRGDSFKALFLKLVELARPNPSRSCL
ncbi:MAG: UDP-N-acetylmuramoyl-L-alanine--D-glutamate ligase [Alphaproteobacteria bacterium]|nr:UDP-N-acetylmuramoyl-L-alanine--D-glutamate ligase [Alphaproteobacteria bacterium]